MLLAINIQNKTTNKEIINLIRKNINNDAKIIATGSAISKDLINEFGIENYVENLALQGLMIISDKNS